MRLHWLLIAVFIAVVAVGCAESDATATSGENEDRSSTPTLDAEFVERAEDVLRTAREPDAGQQVGVILSENADGWDSDWLILTTTGQTLLSVATNCDGDGDNTYESDLWQLLDPGDLVRWSTAGNDSLVCTGEISVQRKNAVGRSES